jgi:hypothetical protein
MDNGWRLQTDGSKYRWFLKFSVTCLNSRRRALAEPGAEYAGT